jgi:hypothetical protein
MGISPLRLGTTTVVAAALAVSFLGQTAAGMRADDRSGVRGAVSSTQASYPDFVDRYVARLKAQSTRPDDRIGVRGPASSTQASDPDFVDRYVARQRAHLVRPAESAPASQDATFTFAFDGGGVTRYRLSSCAGRSFGSCLHRNGRGKAL